MKKLFTIAAIAIISISFTSCRQDDDTAEFSGTTSPQEKTSYNKTSDTIIKIDTTTSHNRVEVDPDPPVRDGTRW